MEDRQFSFKWVNGSSRSEGQEIGRTLLYMRPRIILSPIEEEQIGIGDYFPR